jgi:hypothetical protein
MKFWQISHIVEQMPTDDIYFDDADRGGIYDETYDGAVIANKAFAYSDLRFAWNFIKYAVRSDSDCPYIFAQDPILYRAYLYQRYKSDVWPEFQDAFMLATPARSSDRAVVNGYLLCEDATYENTASRVHMNPTVIEIYEKLFYNVICRKDDALMLATHVWPNTRLVTIFNDYIIKTGLDVHLARLGYDSGEEPLNFFSGLRTASLRNLNLSNPGNMLEQSFMANAYMQSLIPGALNQSHAQGIIHAKALIAADKQAGAGLDAMGEFMGMGEAVMGELRNYTKPIATSYLKNRQRIAGGNKIDATDI